jgi:glycosyltransferase involved in cell wall biosynthesis
VFQINLQAMTSKPLISIITPSYNQGQFIEETIVSVLSQTYKNIQYIVIDGGSDDNTMEVINRYKDDIDIVIHEKDKGQGDAINKGFKLAKGELIGWINSDDILYPDCVERITNLYQMYPDGSIYYCSLLDKIDEFGNIIKTIHLPIPDKKYLQNVNYSIIQQGSFYKNELIKKVGYIDENIHYCMDLDLWLRLLQYGKIYSINDSSCSAFRIWGGTKTTTGGEKFLKNIRYALRKNDTKSYSAAIIKTYWYSFKIIIKSILKYRSLQ